MTGGEQQSWQSVQREVLRRITSGTWKPGDLVPGEVELAEEFGCARATVNRALRELAETGLIERRRKAGTRVATNPVGKARLDIPVTRRDIEQRGAQYGYVLLESERARPPAAVLGRLGRLGLDAEAELLHLRCVHLADGTPYAYEDRWINTDAAPAILSADLEKISANEWLVANVPSAHGDFAFSAVNADAADAHALETREGAALLIVRRSTWTGEVPITHVRLAYAPGHVMRSSD